MSEQTTPYDQSGDEAAAPEPEVRREPVGTGVSASLVVGVLLAVLVIVLAAQNVHSVELSFLVWELTAPLVVILLAAIVGGVVLDEVLGVIWRFRKRRAMREREELRRLRSR